MVRRSLGLDVSRRILVRNEKTRLVVPPNARRDWRAPCLASSVDGALSGIGMVAD